PLKQLSIAFLIACTLAATGRATPATNTVTTSNTIASAEAPNEALDVPAGRYGARYAQRLFRRGKYSEAAEAYLQASRGVSRKASRSFRHNAAVALAEAGDFGGSADIFRELSLQTRRGEKDDNLALGSALFRAAEEIGDAEDAEKAQQRATLLREAGEAFKESWRYNADDENARDNVAITITQLADAEAEAKALALAKQYEQMPAPQLADQMLAEQREIATELPAAITNTSPGRIAQIEALAKRQKSLSDLWTPLKGKLAQAMSQQGSASNAQHFAALTQLMESTHEEMRDGAHKLRDLDAEGFRSSKVAEHGTYQLWKTVAPHDMILREDLRQQTNVIGRVEGTIPPDPYSDPGAIQSEAASLTELFKQRFEQAVPEEGTAPPPGATPAPDTTDGEQPQPEGISAETRAEILKLADEAIAEQNLAATLLKDGDKTMALEAQHQSQEKLTAIQALLPKQQNQQQDQQQQDQQQQDQQDQQQQDQQQNQQEQSEEQEQPEASEPQEEDPEQQDIRKLLEKALEREREHEAEKRRREELIPLPPFERDW
ncbi:MAG: hypothetical protein HN341_01010, partial [Verrucomicrobia bacterium]|nr:hypothetical protein [Verrucomicrobiota bacterium]